MRTSAALLAPPALALALGLAACGGGGGRSSGDVEKSLLDDIQQKIGAEALSAPQSAGQLPAISSVSCAKAPDKVKEGDHFACTTNDRHHDVSVEILADNQYSWELVRAKR